jgi:FkbM family methyltransferase
MTQNETMAGDTYDPAKSDGIAGRLVRTLIRRSRLVRSVIKSATVQHQIMTWRALTVVGSRRGRFLALQLLGGGTGGYELRDSGLTFHVRHRTGDVAILNKIFARDRGLNSYEAPAEVAAAIGTAPRILDVGANIGMFGLWALKCWPGAQITAYEPDPDNLRVLRRTVASNAVGDRWTVLATAVSNAPTELSFVPGLRAEAHIAATHENGTLTVRAIDFYEQQGSGVDLVKMDIEGGEWAILADPRLSELKATAIRLEWHTMLCPQPDAHAAAIELLRSGGFTRILDADYEDERNGVLWAWREPSAASARGDAGPAATRAASAV